MKNQYFGDVHDFRKYGLLRVLISTGLSLGVGWMLTPDDAGPDGQMKRYLTEPEKWRGHDPALYEFLKNIQEQGTASGVGRIEESDLLSGALFYSDFVPDNKEQRELWSNGLVDALKGSDLVFLDPDNGMMVQSKRAGLKDSSKFADWSEVKQLWQEGCSLLVYQHYARQSRQDFQKLTARNLCEATGTRRALLFSTSQVLFILLTQERHGEAVHKALQQRLHLWEGQIKMTSYVQNDQDLSSPTQQCQLMTGSRQTADTENTFRPEDIRHACCTHGIADISDLKIEERTATFNATYYHPSHRDETWSFIAAKREGGGITIKPQTLLSKPL